MSIAHRGDVAVQCRECGCKPSAAMLDCHLVHVKVGAVGAHVSARGFCRGHACNLRGRDAWELVGRRQKATKASNWARDRAGRRGRAFCRYQGLSASTSCLSYLAYLVSMCLSFVCLHPLPPLYLQANCLDGDQTDIYHNQQDETKVLYDSLITYPLLVIILTS